MTLPQKVVSKDCPLCMETLEIDDLSFFPCSCSYQVCRFCWNRIITSENGLCPACRKPYNSEEPASFRPMSSDEIKKIKRKQKSKVALAPTTECLKDMADKRVLLENLLFVMNLPNHIPREEDTLKSESYFGKYGFVMKVVINQNQATNLLTNNNNKHNNNNSPTIYTSAYVTYRDKWCAMIGLLDMNAQGLNGMRSLKVSFGTTKYCSQFIKGQICTKKECMYYHQKGDDKASFSKEDMTAGKHTEYEAELIKQFKEKLDPTLLPEGHYYAPKPPPKPLLECEIAPLLVGVSNVSSNSSENSSSLVDLTDIMSHMDSVSVSSYASFWPTSSTSRGSASGDSTSSNRPPLTQILPYNCLNSTTTTTTNTNNIPNTNIMELPLTPSLLQSQLSSSSTTAAAVGNNSTSLLIDNLQKISLKESSSLPQTSLSSNSSSSSSSTSSPLQQFSSHFKSENNNSIDNNNISGPVNKLSSSSSSSYANVVTSSIIVPDIATTTATASAVLSNQSNNNNSYSNESSSSSTTISNSTSSSQRRLQRTISDEDNNWLLNMVTDNLSDLKRMAMEEQQDNDYYLNNSFDLTNTSTTTNSAAAVTSASIVNVLSVAPPPGFEEMNHLHQQQQHSQQHHLHHNHNPYSLSNGYDNVMITQSSFGPASVANPSVFNMANSASPTGLNNNNNNTMPNYSSTTPSYYHQNSLQQSYNISPTFVNNSDCSHNDYGQQQQQYIGTLPSDSNLCLGNNNGPIYSSYHHHHHHHSQSSSAVGLSAVSQQQQSVAMTHPGYQSAVSDVFHYNMAAAANHQWNGLNNNSFSQTFPPTNYSTTQCNNPLEVNSSSLVAFPTAAAANAVHWYNHYPTMKTNLCSLPVSSSSVGGTTAATGGTMIHPHHHHSLLVGGGGVGGSPYSSTLYTNDTTSPAGMILSNNSSTVGNGYGNVNGRDTNATIGGGY